MRRGTPSRSITSIARGSAASLEVVEKAMIAGSLTALMNLRIGTRKISATGSSTTRTNAARAR